MKKTFTLLSIAILFCSVAECQHGKIAGTVTDVGSKAIHSATVSLLRARDSSSVKFAATDKNGGYEFLEVKDGKYFVSATNVGYSKATSKVLELSSSNSVFVPPLVMSEQARGLAGVMVTAKKPFIESKIDRTIV